mmetsp:Transcript_13979/g.27888  ORF Transcript_13979/g.27888 Transcript_13979/m.27888 type:complete len:90 (+) Transcript_13979:174-443(+)
MNNADGNDVNAANNILTNAATGSSSCSNSNESNDNTENQGIYAEDRGIDADDSGGGSLIDADATTTDRSEEIDLLMNISMQQYYVVYTN